MVQVAKKRAYKFPSSIGGCFQYLRPQTAILFDGPTLFMANFHSFFSMGFKIYTLRCYTVICAKRYDRYVEKPFNRTEKKEYCSISRSRSKKSIFFWSSWASTTSIHRIMDSFVHWTKMNTLTDPLCIWLIFINFSLCGL